MYKNYWPIIEVVLKLLFGFLASFTAHKLLWKLWNSRQALNFIPIRERFGRLIRFKMAERSYSRLDDVDVSETIHDHNMRKAISMLSLVSTPNDSLSESAVETFTEEQNLDLELPISFENDSIEVTDMPISSTAAGMPNF